MPRRSRRGRRAQQAEFTNNFKYNSGQGVQPIFEGWSHAPDGSFNMHFGYLNRNYVEEPYDSGRAEQQHRAGRARPRPADVLLHPHATQPLHRQRAEGLGQEPRADLDGHRQRQDREGDRLAAGSEWEIDPAGGAAPAAAAPSASGKATSRRRVTIDPVSAAKVPAPRAARRDGHRRRPAEAARRGGGAGRQSGRKRRRRCRAAPKRRSTCRRWRAAPARTQPAPVAVPADADSSARKDRRSPGLSGADRPTVTFAPRTSIEGDKRIVNATFTKPGEYVLRAVASDTLESGTAKFVKVAVQ